MSMGLHDLIGRDAETIFWWQMSIRAMLIFFWTLMLVRLGSNRIYGKFGSLDIVIAVILGSILSRALTANAPFIPTLAASLSLVLLHLMLVKISLHSKTIGHLVKGQEIQLIKNGKILDAGMKKAGMTDHDLMEALRNNGMDSTAGVKAAFLERNGKVSILS